MNKLTRRTALSFGILGAAALVSWGAWNWANGQPTQDDLPAPFRAVLNWNGRLWSSLFDPQKEMRATRPTRGKRPRVNGDEGLVTPIDLARWKMEVRLDGDALQRFSIHQIHAMPRTETDSEFRCIEGWSESISYAGVRFSDFMKQLGLDTAILKQRYRYVGLETPDGKYYVSIDIESALHPQTLLAYEMNGAPIDLANGAPLRLIIPIKYGIKSLKRIGRVTFSNTRPPDFWAEQGYDWFAGL